jgi:hypothetical protein
LNKIAKKYKIKISETKTKAMAMCGNTIQRVKIKIIEQVSALKYSGNTISHYNNDAQLESNIQIYNRMNGIIRRHFGNQTSKETQLRRHNITSKSALRYGSENWILKQK